MNVPERMPVVSSVDPIRTHWLLALLGVNVLGGAACLLAPAGDTSQALLYTAGGLLLVSALLVASGWYVVGGVVGGFGWGALIAACLYSTAHWTVLACVAAIVVGYLAVQHALIMYDVGKGLDRDRERRQRRR